MPRDHSDRSLGLGPAPLSSPPFAGRAMQCADTFGAKQLRVLDNYEINCAAFLNLATPLSGGGPTVSVHSVP